MRASSQVFLGKSRYAEHGQRIVEGQRMMQAALAETYADRNERDYRALKEAAASGRFMDA